MKKASAEIIIFLCLLALQTVRPVYAQENRYQVVDFIELPDELQINPDSLCSMEFREQWIVNAANFSITKKVDRYLVPCINAIGDITEGKGAERPFGVTYEFSFLDPHNAPIQDLQKEFITMFNKRFPGQNQYDLQEQLLSVNFHEEWLIVPETNEIVKKVKGFTPVIWQKRQTVEGEAITDAETGYPVYYTLTLERINLRNP
jgi:hypothetical protein